MTKTSPIRPANEKARALAASLLAGMRFAALAVLNPETGRPDVTRVALISGPEGVPLSLVSDLSAHTRALKADPRASLLVGEPGNRGDPLTHPRLSLACTAQFIGHSHPKHAGLRAHYLKALPKAKLYVDFADFHFVRFQVQSAALNGGFGKAFHLTPPDLGL